MCDLWAWTFLRYVTQFSGLDAGQPLDGCAAAGRWARTTGAEGTAAPPTRRGARPPTAAQEGGILPIGRDWGVSPRWNAIFAVDDCDVTIKRAKELGGSEIFVHTVPKAGRIGSLSDPGGAVFVIRGPVP